MPLSFDISFYLYALTNAIMSEFQKNQKKVINGWVMYDWANSAFFLVVATAIFPPFFEAVTPKVIDVFGLSINNSAFYSYMVALTYLIMAFMTPTLSGIADYSGRKRLFLRSFVLFGSIACMLLFFFKGVGQMWLGILCFMVSTIGCAGSLVFYDAYIPEIATKDKYDKISAKGYAFGYIGSMMLLIGILTIMSNAEKLGITDGTFPARLGFLLVGLWWLLFSQVSFRVLPKGERLKWNNSFIARGNKEVKKVFDEVKKDKSISNYLISFFFFSAGVQTVVYVASVFASKVLNFAPEELIKLILLIQVVAIIGAYLMTFISKSIGNKKTMILQIFIWMVICAVASQVENKDAFYIIAAFVGMVIGGIQSLARSSYSKMIPREDDLTSYYSFLDILYKLSIVVGTFAFGIVEDITGDMRNSILLLSFFFIIAIFFMFRVNPKRINGK